VEGLPGRMVAGFALAGVAAIGRWPRSRPTAWRGSTGGCTRRPTRWAPAIQLIQSRLALGSGGVFGVGLGSSRGKWNFIPNPETDFIFAILGEELGLVGAAVVLALFAALLYVGLRIAYACEEGFGRTVAFAITAWVVGQALINVGTVTGLLPITGVTLPLVSVGGSSLVTSLVALGILASIARRPQATPSKVSR
jgi:cell division protein FtsW